MPAQGASRIGEGPAERYEGPRLTILHVSKSGAEFSYHESLIGHLCARGHRVHALFDRRYSEGRSDRAVTAFAASAEGFTTGWSVRPGPVRSRAAIALHELATLSSYLHRPRQSPFYKERFEGGMPGWLRPTVRRGPLRALLRREDAPARLHRLAQALPPDPRIVAHLRELRPDVVIASPANMRHTFEAEYLRAAKHLAIPTVIPVFSWDNLTTKSLFPILPDLMLVWNQTQAVEATEIHHLPKERVEITGAPLFDRWHRPELGRRTREEFCARIGVDPGRRYICYLGSTAGIAQDETWLVQGLAEAIRAHESPEIRELAIIVRPHPLHTAVYEALIDEKIQVWPRGGEMPDSSATLADFHDTLRFTEAAIGINTTGMLDAVIVGRPCIAVLAERYRRTQEQALHFQHLRRGGVVEEVSGPAECLDVVAGLLAGRDRTEDQRRRFVAEFIRPWGTEWPAGAVAAAAVERLAATRSAPRQEPSRGWQG